MIINSEELKNVLSIAKHFPNRKNNTIGVSSRIVYEYINKAEKCLLQDVKIDGTRYFIIPLADQDKEDWGLKEKLFGANSK